MNPFSGQRHYSNLLTQHIMNQHSGKMYKYQIRHSRHSQRRSAQRAIDKATILAVLDFGTLYFRQGMSFYAINEKDLPDHVDKIIRKKVKNLVVVMSPNETQIVTCYWSKNPHKYLKRKGKILL